MPPRPFLRRVWDVALAPLRTLVGLDPAQRTKVTLLSSWFFLVIMALWLLKPVRVASLLARLGAEETPYVRLAAVVTVGVIVLVYSRVINGLTRLQVAWRANVLFTALLGAYWLALRFGGAALGAQRPFVWSVYILVEIYSTVMVGIFWTYVNDVVTPDEADKLYGPIGLGGILGGVVGGAFVDLFTRSVGAANLLLVCAGILALSLAFPWLSEAKLHPPGRKADPHDGKGFAAAVEGAREVSRNTYLLLVVGIVVAYEFTAALTDFGISIVFENAFRHNEVELTRMYGRLGWISSGVAIVSQVVLVPLLLPTKRVALLVPPLAMIAAALGLFALPIAALAMVLGAADRGLNYSIQQVTKETLYVPLTDAQKYKAKAFIDMFVDRAAKGLAALALIPMIASYGLSVKVTLGMSLLSMILWFVFARTLGVHYERVKEAHQGAGAEPGGPVVRLIHVSERAPGAPADRALRGDPAPPVQHDA